MKTLRILLGVIVGYAVMVLFITLVQETWFGGVGWYESTLTELGVAGLFTCLSAAIGAAAGSAIAGSRRFIVASIMSTLVVIETTALTIFQAVRERRLPQAFAASTADGAGPRRRPCGRGVKSRR